MYYGEFENSQCDPGNYGTQEVCVIFSLSADKAKELRVRKRLL